jgi:hypothetical protein
MAYLIDEMVAEVGAASGSLSNLLHCVCMAIDLV